MDRSLSVCHQYYTSKEAYKWSSAPGAVVRSFLSHTRLLKLFTSVTSHSAGDVDNLDRGVMAHENHSVKTWIYSHGVVRLNGDRHDIISFFHWELNLIYSEEAEGLLHKHPNILMWEVCLLVRDEESFHCEENFNFYKTLFLPEK